MSGFSRAVTEVLERVRSRRSAPYLALLAVAIFCHGFLLTNDGLIWDSWFVRLWLKEKNWAAMAEFFGSVGIPLYAALYWPFAFVPDIVSAFMWATFLCLLASGILTYRIALALNLLGPGEALAVAALSVAMPLFLAAQDFIMFFFIFTHTLFLGAALSVAHCFGAHGWRHWVLRGLGVAAFLLSFSNAGLLAYYGAIYILFFVHFRALRGLPFFAGAMRFSLRYPELLVLPPVAWVLRLWLTPQYGWYQHYNSIGTNLHKAGDSLWSFVKYVVPFHLQRTAEWPIAHPAVTVLLLAAVAAWLKWAPRNWVSQRSTSPSLVVAAFGLGALFVALLPYAVAGKHFIEHPVGEDSHHLLLTGIPAAILIFAALRPLLWWQGTAASRSLFPIAACGVVVLGSQVTPEYVAERAEWVFCRSLLHNAARNEVVRESSVIYVSDKFSLTKQHVYEIYAFGEALGGVSRFVSHHTPVNGRFFTPPEILSTLMRTTVLPSEYKNIDPSGQQIWLRVERRPGGLSDWETVTRYLRLSWFGDRAELDRFVADLTALQTHILKPRTSLASGGPAPANGQPTKARRPPSGHFTNAFGMRMNFLPWSWWAGKYEVTQDQFERVMGYNPSLFKDAGRPVECVSWNEAADFCRRLTEDERNAGRVPDGFVYRLPTSEEFDHLVTPGTEANAVIATAEVQWWTARAGTRPANGLGLHDVGGNVWEWCLDWWDADRRFKVSKGAAWTSTPGSLGPRPAGWNQSDPYERAAADRLYGMIRRDYPDQAFWNRGFRVVLARAVPEPVMRSKE